MRAGLQQPRQFLVEFTSSHFSHEMPLRFDILSGSEIELDEAIECNVFFRRHRRRIPRAIKLGMRDAEYWKLLMKRLIFCFDGTWDPLDARYPTNVVITAESVIPVTYEPVPVSQFIFYDEAVCTETLKWHDHAHSPR